MDRTPGYEPDDRGSYPLGSAIRAYILMARMLDCLSGDRGSIPRMPAKQKFNFIQKTLNNKRLNVYTDTRVKESLVILKAF